MLLQFVIAWHSVRFDTIERVAKSEPAGLLRDGKTIYDELRRERVTVDQIKAALRGEGLGDFQLAALVVLDTDGSLSVVPKSSAGSHSTFPSPSH